MPSANTLLRSSFLLPRYRIGALPSTFVSFSATVPATLLLPFCKNNITLRPSPALQLYRTATHRPQFEMSRWFRQGTTLDIAMLGAIITTQKPTPSEWTVLELLSELENQRAKDDVGVHSPSYAAVRLLCRDTTGTRAHMRVSADSAHGYRNPRSSHPC